MKNLINKMIFGKNANVSLFAVLGILSFVVLGCTGLGRKDTNSVVTNSSPSATSTPTASTPKPTFVKADASKAEMPSDPELQDMVKKTLLDFDKAVDEADFTDFYDNISKAWKKQTSPSELKTSFQGFIDKKISISKISSMEADFSPDPVVEKEIGYKTLKLQGRYDTSPNSTKFLLHYIPDGKDWKLSRIEVDTTKD